MTVLRLDGELRAIDSICFHAGGPLVGKGSPLTPHGAMQRTHVAEAVASTPLAD